MKSEKETTLLTACQLENKHVKIKYYTAILGQKQLDRNSQFEDEDGLQIFSGTDINPFNSALFIDKGKLIFTTITGEEQNRERTSSSDTAL